MKLATSLLYLHVALVLAKGSEDEGGNITCSVPIVEPHKDTVLTCNFPEDLNATRKDFSVYHYNKGVNSDAVLDCWWFGGTMECFQSPNIRYSRIVSKTLNITFRQVTSNHTSTYACQVAGYDPSYFKTCDLQIKMAEASQSADERNHSLAVGLSVGVLLLAIFVIAGFILLSYKGTMRIMSMACKLESHALQPHDESHPMLQDKKDKNKMFEEYLEEEVFNMFPNILESAYFVPPVYFNKIRNKPLFVTDQIRVNVLEPPDPLDAIHDRAMQHVLDCLHHVAIAGEEKMFVRTQFKYADYLNSIPKEFRSNLLPVSSLTQEHEQNRNFDFLIIHRQYGVMVGVVKTCSSDDENQPKTDKMNLSQLSEAMEQLQTAGRFITKVMSDKENFPKVRQVLVLFNIAQPTVKRLTRDIPGMNQNPNELWRLCFYQLPDCLESNSSLVNSFKEEWDKLAKESQDNFKLNEKHYLAIIGRFCGPATSSVFLMEKKSYQLPKTLSQAVSITGDMFEQTFLYQNMTELLKKESFLFLAGPPGTGKTRMLELIGRKWICDGHPVHIISTSPGGKEVATHLKQLISTTVSSGPVNVFHLNLNLEDTSSVIEELDTIKNKQTNEAYFIAVELNFQMRQSAKRFLLPATKWFSFGYDVVKATVNYVASLPEPPTTNTEIDINDIPPIEDNIQRRKSVAFLFTELLHRFPNLQIWGAGCTDLDLQAKVPDLRMEFLTECLTCPPSVLREACDKTRISGVGKYTANQSPVPTNGPPVKHLYHQGQGHFVKHSPQECALCAKEIISILIQDLCIEDEAIKIDVSPQKTHTGQQLQPVPIRYSDILIFCESDVNENTQLVKFLKDKGIPVMIITHPNQSIIVKQEISSVLVAKSSLFVGRRRKVVVFVEGDTDSNDIIVRWNRLQCWTRCTSQLILVHNVKT